MRSGTEEQRARFLPAIAAGKALWCQAFSEPDAGSDLSRIRTTATVTDEGILVNGRKVWISYADIAENCFLLARHVDPAADAGTGSRARTVLLVPMSTPGITVREIGSIVGDHVFHELVFDDVRLPHDAVLGDPARGWDVVKAALADERGGAPEYMQAEGALSGALGATGEGTNDLAAAAVGEAWVRTHGARLLTYRAVDDRAHGDDGARSAYQARAYGRVARQAVADAMAELHVGGGAETLHQDEEVESLNAILAGVAGGAYEILLDLLAPAPRESR
jgi:alkylation response protein AidB-like acyl-CoA dehydrogenase